MISKEIRIELKTKESVSGVLSVPDNETDRLDTGIVFAHGAANDMNNPLIRAVARGLCGKGYTCLRFNFSYREKQKKSVDPEHLLVNAWQQALGVIEAEPQLHRVVAAGKSLGARIAAQACAAGEIEPDGLIFLGYPLHAPGRKDKLRDAPLYEVKQPMLFFEGTRDPFCDLALLGPVLERCNASTTLEIIEDGDHSLQLPKARSDGQAGVHQAITDTGAEWIQARH